MVRTGTTFAEAADEWLRYVEHDRVSPALYGAWTTATCAVRYLIPEAFGQRERSRRSPPRISTAGSERLVHQEVSSREDGSNKQLAAPARDLQAGAAGGYGGSRATRPPPGRAAGPEHRSGDFQVLGGRRSPPPRPARTADGPGRRDLHREAAFTGLRLGELLALRWAGCRFRQAARARTVVNAGARSDRPAEVAPRAFRPSDRPGGACARRPLPPPRATSPADGDLVFIRGPDGQHLDGDQLRKRYRVALQQCRPPADPLPRPAPHLRHSRDPPRRSA